MIAAIADGSAFKRGRDFAAWLGLVQRQLSTGGRTLLGSMPKRDNSHLRRLFIHGACSFRLSGNHERHAIGGWLDALDRRAQERGDRCAGRNGPLKAAFPWRVGQVGYVLNDVSRDVLKDSDIGPDGNFDGGRAPAAVVGRG